MILKRNHNCLPCSLILMVLMVVSTDCINTLKSPQHPQAHTNNVPHHIFTKQGKDHEVSPKEDCYLSGGEEKVIPDFLSFLDGVYTMEIEATETISKKTFYIQESHQIGVHEDHSYNEFAVRIVGNYTEEVVYYYTDFIRYWNGGCQHFGSECPFCPHGWFDQSHEPYHYGPSSLLRLAYFTDRAYITEGGLNYINDIESEGWKACSSDKSVEYNYYFSIPKYSMPDQPFFNMNDTRFPVQFSARSMAGDHYWEYNIMEFVPYIKDHRLLEPPRGGDCEDIADYIWKHPVPTMPDHFSFSQEVVQNSLVDGIMVDGEAQILDKNTVYYSSDLSVVRMDFTPAVVEETPFMSLHPLKVIRDFNTGVEYFIDLVDGNCTRGRLTPHSATSHHHGFFQTDGTMQSGNEFLKLTGIYAFLGMFYDRHMMDERWTSTRDDIKNPSDGTTYKKAVLEWDFLILEQFGRNAGEGRDVEPREVPVRANLFIYSEEESWQIRDILTANVYDYAVRTLHDEEEFNVFECFERNGLEWSYLLITFPTNEKQNEAVAQVPDLVHHQIFDQVITYGKMSPVRISSIDITTGIQGAATNHTSTDVMLASVRVLERAPYIYSYTKNTEGSTIPGVNEMKYANLHYVDECAEFCSITQSFDCKSFHVCDNKDCYLSQYETSDGEPVQGVTSCEHWVLDLQNETFPDLPTNQAVFEIQLAIMNGSFVLSLHDEMEGPVTVPASEAFHYKSPDLANAITGKFYVALRHHELTKPESTFMVNTLEDCELLCVSMQEYECLSVAYNYEELVCHLSSKHFDEMDASEYTSRSRSDIFSKYYLVDYSPVLGGVKLNSSGPVYNNVFNLESCARLCTKETSIQCRSFEVCVDDLTCRLHEEAYLDSTTSGDYDVMTHCTHFTSNRRSDFTSYNNQGLPSNQHRLVLYDTNVETCAQLCVEDTEETCESFDYCEICAETEQNVCGSENYDKFDTCYLSANHLGEPGVELVEAPHCQHYERDYFGDLTYAQWKDKQRKASMDPYTSGDMVGLAFGMIFLGILVTAGVIFFIDYQRRGPMSNTPMSFANLKRRSGETKA